MITEDQKEQARRDYRFNLESKTDTETPRCYSCQYRKSSECSLLDIAIAVPSKSNCPLYEWDGIPF